MIERYESVVSTMETARERALAGAAHGTAIVAETQTGGRGRRGRTWFSPPRAGVWMTLILRPPQRVTDEAPLHFFGLVAGVAVRRAVMTLGAQDVMLKWPNDVVVHDRKLAGILLEAEGVDTPSPLLLAGIGLNLAPAHALTLPDDIRDRYVGLYDLIPHPPTDILYKRVSEALHTALMEGYDLWRREGARPFVEAFEEADALRDAKVRCEVAGGPLLGTARGITGEGALIVDLPHERVHVTSGEVVRVRQSR